MTWLELRPTRTVSLSPARWHAGVYARMALFILAWAVVAIHWLSWQALPFQAAIAGAVLWHALKREALLERQTAMEEQLREAQERYRDLVETLPLATYVDRANEVTGAAWVSPQIAEITSYRPEEWTADPDLLSKVLHPGDRERVLAEMARVKATNEPLDHEYRLLRRDGSIVWIHDSAVTTTRNGERFTRGFVVDVTARCELDRLKDEFVALVSHELRTPLTSIRGYVELMREDDELSTAERSHFLETIDRNAHRLQRVVGDLLFCAQVEAGTLSLEQGVVDVNGVVADSVDAARPAADSKPIALAVALGESPQIEGDRARLSQVLDNLVSNAVKFTPAGGTVSVATRRVGGDVEITVADTGMGIPAHELPRLFQRFFRTERATARAVPGTGLGLAIAKSIVEGHGGHITVESEADAGTTFRVVLPAAA